MLALFIGPVSGWNLKRSAFSAKLSLGDIMSTKMHVSDDKIDNTMTSFPTNCKTLLGLYPTVHDRRMVTIKH